MPRKRPKRNRRARGTGTVWEYAPGLWAGQLPRAVDPSRRTLYGFASEDQANDELDAEIARILDRRTLDQRSDQPFGHYLERWYGRREPFLAAQTRPYYYRAVAFMAPIADVPLSELTHEHFERVWADLRRRGLALTTIRQARGVIATALNAAVPKLIPENPGRRARVPTSQPKIRCWDQAERYRFLLSALTEARYPALWLILATLGPRPGEARGLRCGDIDWERGMLTIERSLTDAGAIEGPTKSRRSRTVRLYDLILDELEAAGARDRPPTDWLFPGEDDGQPWHRKSMWRELAAIRKHANLWLAQDVADGLPAVEVPPIGLYDCRHTAATIALASGVPLADVSYMLGHADPSITLKHYAHWLPSGQEAAARMIAASLAPTRAWVRRIGTSPSRSPLPRPLAFESAG